MAEYSTKHYADLTPRQQMQLVSLLSGRHLFGQLKQKDPAMKKIEMGIYAINPNDDNHPVALLKNNRVIAGIVTDSRHTIRNFAGLPDREFIETFGHTPAMELLRHNLEINKGKLRIRADMIGPFAKRLIDRRIMVRGVTAAFAGGRRLINVPDTARMTPALSIKRNVWRPYVR